MHGPPASHTPSLVPKGGGRSLHTVHTRVELDQDCWREDWWLSQAWACASYAYAGPEILV